jgi:hypothetical protein
VFSARLSGVVRDPSGRPICSAELTLLPVNVRVLSGVGGEFAFQHVAAAGHVAASLEEIDLPRGAVLRQEVTLTPRFPAPVTRVWRDGMAHRASVR